MPSIHINSSSTGESLSAKCERYLQDARPSFTGRNSVFKILEKYPHPRNEIDLLDTCDEIHLLHDLQNGDAHAILAVAIQLRGDRVSPCHCCSGRSKDNFRRFVDCRTIPELSAGICGNCAFGGVKRYQCSHRCQAQSQTSSWNLPEHPIGDTPSPTLSLNPRDINRTSDTITDPAHSVPVTQLRQSIQTTSETAQETIRGRMSNQSIQQPVGLSCSRVLVQSILIQLSSLPAYIVSPHRLQNCQFIIEQRYAFSQVDLMKAFLNEAQTKSNTHLPIQLFDAHKRALESLGRLESDAAAVTEICGFQNVVHLINTQCKCLENSLKDFHP
jgi:hypothetical protein